MNVPKPSAVRALEGNRGHASGMSAIDEVLA